MRVARLLELMNPWRTVRLERDLERLSLMSLTLLNGMHAHMQGIDRDLITGRPDDARKKVEGLILATRRTGTDG